MVMPAMIETTSVDDPTNGRSCGPASRNICGFNAITNAATAPISFGAGLSRTPFAASALISSEGYGSITATRFASSPCASQPDSIAPPILPAPASTMVPCRSDSALVGEASSQQPSTSSPRRPGPITTVFVVKRERRPQAPCKTSAAAAMGPLSSRNKCNTVRVLWRWDMLWKSALSLRLHAAVISKHIASALGRVPSTISRELRRNCGAPRSGGGLRACPGSAIGRASATYGWPLQAGAPAGPARTEWQKPCDGTFAGADRWPTGAGTWSRHHQPRVNLSFHLSSVGQKDYWHRLLPRHKLRRGHRGRRGGSPASFIKQRRPITERPAEVEVARCRATGKPTSCCSPDMARGCLFCMNDRPASTSTQRPVDRKAVRTASTIARHSANFHRRCAKPSASTTEPSSPSITGFTRLSASKPSSAIPTVPGKRAVWKTPSDAYDVTCRAKPISTPSPQPTSSGTFSVSTTPHANAWISRHPLRHS